MIRTALSFLFLIAAGYSRAQEYTISTFAGGAPPPTPALGPNMLIEGEGKLGIATDSAGNVYFTSFNCIFKLDQNGIVTRVAGTSRAGYSGDGGPAIDAQLNFVDNWYVGISNAGLPAQLVVDNSGNLYIADSGNYRIRRISSDGVIITIAGNGTAGFSGDGGLATDAQLTLVGGLAVDFAGNVFFSDLHRVRKVSQEAVITTIAGTGVCGFSGDGGPAAAAALCKPLGLIFDSAGKLLIADSFNSRVREITADEIISTVLGKGTPGFSDQLALIEPTSIAADPAGNLFIARTTVDEYDGDFVQMVVNVSPAGNITTAAGNGLKCNWNVLTGDCDFSLGDGRPASGAVLHGPLSVAVDAVGSLIVADTWNSRVRKVSPDGIITSEAGVPGGSLASDRDRPSSANLFFPRGVAVDSASNVFISDTDDARIRKVSPEGVITTVAGGGLEGLSGDGGSATNARLYAPYGLAADRSGNVFIADVANGRVRKISPDGTITSVDATTGFGYVYGVAADGTGNLFFAGTPGFLSDNIRKVSADGAVTPVAKGYAPAVDGAGNLFFVSGFRVLKLSPDGTVTSIAGNGSQGFSGDGGLATDAQLSPSAVAVDASGNVFIADFGNNRIRKVSSDGIIATIAGNGTPGYTGDDGPATKASISMPFSVAVDDAGNIYVADAYNNSVRVLRPVATRQSEGAHGR
jgi:sugar lactone lactonase YvrE